LVKKSSVITSYNSLSLLGAINNLKPFKRIYNKPLRLPIRDVYKICGVGTVLVGKVTSGVLKAGMRV